MQNAAQAEWLQRRVELRGDLIFSPREYGDRWLYHIEDPTRSKFFQLGTAEYAFVSLLDATRGDRGTTGADQSSHPPASSASVAVRALRRAASGP